MEKQVQVSTVGILPVEKVRKLERKIRFRDEVPKLIALFGAAICIVGLSISYFLQNSELGEISLVLFLLSLFVALVDCEIPNKYRKELKFHEESLAQAKKQHTQNYLNEHPELIELAKEKSVVEQAQQKVHNTVYNLIDVNGNIDENAVLEALKQ